MLKERKVTDQSSGRNAVAAGTSAVAAIVLVGIGALQFFQGIAALANDELFVVGIDYVYRFDLTTWGWIHLILGLLVALVGFALIFGATWSRIAAVVLLALSIVANFLWIPYYPWWSVILIAVAALAIWAIASWNPER